MISFSICIPNYNYARYIGETIQSVLNQTYPHFEIVVVDNASTDNSVEVVKSFRDPRIKLFVNQYNVGFAPNLDRAAQRASNPYIIMLSSDDLMESNALEEYADIISLLGSKADTALIFASVNIINSDGAKKGEMHRRQYFELPPRTDVLPGKGLVECFWGLEVFREVYPRMTVPGHFCSTAYSQQLYHRVGGYSSLNHIGPDAHFVYKALLEDVLVVFINKLLFSYRVHSSNQLSQNQARRTIKLPIDRYLFSIQYEDEQLERAGVRRNSVARFVVEDSCLKEGLRELRDRHTTMAFRHLMFAFSAYPVQALKNWKSYLLLFMICLGPVGSYLTRLGYRFNQYVSEP
jgi:glycosyltransferase involved in cell wall biosynthesis